MDFTYPLTKMRAAEVPLRLRLNLWIKPQYYNAIASQPSGEDFRALFNVPRGIILACLRRRCLVLLRNIGVLELWMSYSRVLG